MTPSRSLFVVVPALAALALALAPALLSAKDHYIGPAGFIGSTSKNEIKVSKVEKGSPADGSLKPGDVIVAAGGRKFTGDARLEIAARIDEAESEASGGKLKLTLKDGREVELKLEVLGTYAETAPYDCAKTDAIVTRVADKLLETGSYKQGQIVVGWLGLMATGEEKYLDVVRKELPAQDWANPNRADCEALLRGEKDMGYVGWYWGYSLIALGEYHLMTGDESVLPAIETYALSLARGQDAAGTWGHRMAVPTRGNRLPGYAHINQPSLSCLIGLVLAEKCGVGGRELTEAIDRCIAFFGTYVGEGAIPYGVHDPNSRIFNNNGSSAMAGLAMALRGEKGAEFFSHQAAAAHDILETGHATYYFNVLWTPLGAATAGPEVTRAFFDRSRWLHTLYRSWDHRFTYDGGESKACNSSGSLLLAYCLPRRQLHITGKGADESLWVKGDEVAGVVDAGRIDYAALDVDGLLDLFGHPAPQVTRRAIWALRERKGDFVPRLVTMMESGSDIEQRSAFGYFGYQCPDEVAAPQVERLGRILRDPGESSKVRAAAADALSWRGGDAHRYYPDMLRFVVEDEADDPFGLIDKSVGRSLVTLCANPFEAGLVTDKDLFYAAAQKLARNKRAEGRDCGMKLLRHMPAGDFHRVADDVKAVVINNDPTFHSYHNPQTAVQEGVLLLADLGVEEGIGWAYDTLDTPWGKAGFKARAILQMLAAYGGHAKPMVEKLKADPERVRMLSGGRWKGMWDAMLKAVEQPPDKPLISFEEAKRAGQGK